jgi:hypothetical protein
MIIESIAGAEYGERCSGGILCNLIEIFISGY